MLSRCSVYIYIYQAFKHYSSIAWTSAFILKVDKIVWIYIDTPFEHISHAYKKISLLVSHSFRKHTRQKIYRINGFLLFIRYTYCSCTTYIDKCFDNWTYCWNKKRNRSGADRHLLWKIGPINISYGYTYQWFVSQIINFRCLWICSIESSWDLRNCNDNISLKIIIVAIWQKEYFKYSTTRYSTFIRYSSHR